MKPTGGAMVLQQVDPVTSFQHLDLVWKPFLKVRMYNPEHITACICDILNVFCRLAFQDLIILEILQLLESAYKRDILFSLINVCKHV